MNEYEYIYIEAKITMNSFIDIDIYIYLDYVYIHTHTHRHTDRHTNGRAQISLWYIYVCIYLLQQIMADWLSLAVLVGVVAIMVP